MSIAVLTIAGLSAILGTMAPERFARRGNTVLVRDGSRPVYSVAAMARLGVLAGTGSSVIQPVGFGAGLQFRYHGLGLGPLRFGLELIGGHTHFLERREVTVPDRPTEDQTAVRYAALGHTDFAAGPAFQFVIGPTIVELGAGAGVAINSFVRPMGPFVTDEQRFSDVSALVRGGGHVGIPLRDNHGIVIGGAVQQVFSETTVVIGGDPDVEAESTREASPFDLVASAYLGYQMWF